MVRTFRFLKFGQNRFSNILDKCCLDKCHYYSSRNLLLKIGQNQLIRDNRDKLGLKWAKLSSNWNWALLWLIFAALHWWLPTTIAYPESNKPVNLATSTYLHTSLLTCMLACLLTFLYTCLQRRPNCPLLTVNSNHPKSHTSQLELSLAIYRKN